MYKPKARKTELTAEQQAERDRKETLAAHIKMKEQLRNRARCAPPTHPSMLQCTPHDACCSVQHI